MPGSHINQVIRSILYQAEYFDRLSNFEKALELTKKAHQYIHSAKTDEDHKVYFHLGLYSEKLGKVEDAIAYYQQAIAVPQSDTKFRERCNRRLNQCLTGKSQNNGKPSKLRSLLVAIKNFVKSRI